MSYIGCLVSLNCGDSLGVYQGQVQRVDDTTQTLTLSHPFRNGIKCEVPEVTISACDIKQLVIVKTADEAEHALTKKATPSKLSRETAEELDIAASPGRVVEPKVDQRADYSQSATGNNNVTGSYKSSLSQSLKRDSRKSDNNGRYQRNSNTSTPGKERLGFDDGACGSVSPSRNTPTYDGSNSGAQYRKNSNRDKQDDTGYGRHSNRNTPTKDDSFRPRRNSASESRAAQRSSVPRRIEFKKKAQNRQDCFSAPVDSLLDEFDFEKNLALFDKKAVFEEIESNTTEGELPEKAKTKYRCDENVLQSKPVKLQQIKVPKDYGGSYVTDSGLVVPCIDYELRNKLFDIADACGFTVERRLEMIGRSSSEMILQLLGGSSRLNPQNGHQLPTVLILCGPHIQGAQGLSCARHLNNHNVKTIVFLPNFLRMIQIVELELKLYEMCNGKRYSVDKDMPTTSIDMIVNCMDSHENSFLKDQIWYQNHVQWVKQCRAPVFTIDPPIESVDIVPKWCLYPALPLATLDMTSQMYLCDLGLPRTVYKNAGVTYRSPFGHKFIIPLHPSS